MYTYLFNFFSVFCIVCKLIIRKFINVLRFDCYSFCITVIICNCIFIAVILIIQFDMITYLLKYIGFSDIQNKASHVYSALAGICKIS